MIGPSQASFNLPLTIATAPCCVYTRRPKNSACDGGPCAQESGGLRLRIGSAMPHIADRGGGPKPGLPGREPASLGAIVMIGGGTLPCSVFKIWAPSLSVGFVPAVPEGSSASGSAPVSVGFASVVSSALGVSFFGTAALAGASGASGVIVPCHGALCQTSEIAGYTG